MDTYKYTYIYIYIFIYIDIYIYTNTYIYIYIHSWNSWNSWNEILAKWSAKHDTGRRHVQSRKGNQIQPRPAYREHGDWRDMDAGLAPVIVSTTHKGRGEGRKIWVVRREQAWMESSEASLDGTL